MNDEIENLTKQIIALNKIVNMQRAQIKALELMTLTKIDDLQGLERGTTHKDYKIILRKAYDEVISKIESSNPAEAAALDIRPLMRHDVQSDWYLPDLPPSGG